MSFVEHKRQCPECKIWYGRRTYTSGQTEPPCNFNRRLTCGKPTCVKAAHRKKRAESKVVPIDVIDRFIYRGRKEDNFARAMDRVRHR